jgi:serine/threonine-protein kinase RsbT
MATAMANETVLPINTDVDIMLARQQGKAIARTLRFSESELTLIATAISEIARNIINYATRGEVTLALVQRGPRRGLRIVARDQGPGIRDIARAMEDGYSTSRGLGLGLPGSKRLMDEFDIVSEVGKGTTVTMTKWER